MAKKCKKENKGTLENDFFEGVLYKVIVVGAGGTGGVFLKEFSRYLVGLNLHADYYIFDGDTVEEHNLARQCFQKEDIGAPKAAVLAEVLNDAFGVKWIAFPKYVISKEQLLNDVKISEANNKRVVPIILGCVDNHGCRLILEDVFNSLPNCIYFDSANEYESGEVVLSYKINGKKISKLRTEIFPDILNGVTDTRNVTELSCEELNEHSPQHITTNLYAGLTLLSKTISFIKDKRIMPGFICFNSSLMSSEFYPAQYND